VAGVAQGSFTGNGVDAHARASHTRLETSIEAYNDTSFSPWTLFSVDYDGLVAIGGNGPAILNYHYIISGLVLVARGPGVKHFTSSTVSMSITDYIRPALFSPSFDGSIQVQTNPVTNALEPHIGWDLAGSSEVVVRDLRDPGFGFPPSRGSLAGFNFTTGLSVSFTTEYVAFGSSDNLAKPLLQMWSSATGGRSTGNGYAYSHGTIVLDKVTADRRYAEQARGMTLVAADGTIIPVEVAPVPLPGALPLLVLGAAALAAMRLQKPRRER
jgi:hypothetical protein